MQIDDAMPQAGPDSEYLWLHEGSLARRREDRITEAVAVIALLFSLSVGLVIALLPVSAKAAAATLASREASGTRLVADATPHAAGVQRVAHAHD